jgi:hypothetical protein
MKVWHRLALIGLVVVIIGGVRAASAQDGPDRDLLVKAILYLAERLGKPISRVDTYTYEATTFTDAALGCPEPGKSYAPGPLLGFKFLFTLGNTSYDVRATRDGAIIAVCAAIINTNAPTPTIGSLPPTAPPDPALPTASPTVPPPPTAIPPTQEIGLAVYRGAGYSIAYPNRWDVTDRSVDIFFGPGTSPRCDGPGMTVTALGAAGNQLPDALINGYLQSLGRAEVLPDRVDIRRLGRSAVYIAPCANGAPRIHRVTAFVAYGQAYRVVQFAPQADFAGWDGKFLEILEQFAPSTVGGGDGVAIQPPQTAPLALIGHVFGGNVYRGTLVDLPGFPVTTGGTASRPYRDVMIAPNGAFLAFVDPNARTLFVASTLGGAPRQVAGGIAVGYPAAWSPDSGKLAFMAEADGQLQVKIVTLANGQIANRAAAGPSATCPSPATDPADRLYEWETGSGGNRLALWWADERLYHSYPCGVGLAEVAPNNAQSVEVTPSLRRIAPSPDGRRVAGLDGDRLVVVDLDSKQVTPVVPAVSPDQIGWSADGSSLFYSALSPRDPVVLDAPEDAERGQAVFGEWPYTLRPYTVSLRRIDLSTGADAEFWSVEGRGVGRFLPSPDGSGLLFSLIQSPRSLVDAFVNNVSLGDLRRQAPTIQLYWAAYPLGGTPLIVAVSGGAVWGSVGSAAAPTPTGGMGAPTRTVPVVRPTLTPTRPTATRTPEEIPPTARPGVIPTNTPRPTRTP